MTPREMFETVAGHLLRQGRQSLRDGKCAYRGGIGCKCAVGVLIADEHYTPELETWGVATAAVVRALEASGIAVNAPGVMRILYRLQNLHDKFPSECWAGMLDAMRKEFP